MGDFRDGISTRRQKERRIFIPYTEWGIISVATASNVSNAVETILISAKTAGVIVSEVSTFGFTGLQMSTDADTVDHIWFPDYEMDYAGAINFRVHYTTASTTAADTVNWILLYGAISGVESTVEALAVAATALDTTIASDTVATTTALVPRRSEWGTINAGTLTEGDIITLNLEMDASAASEEILFLGLDIEYVTRKRSFPNYAA